MIIAAVGDIHSPRFLPLFLKSLSNITVNPDVFILLGDIVEKNNIEALSPVYQAVKEKFKNVPVLGVFGNEEYRGFEREYYAKYPEISWLNDELKVISLKGLKTCIVGTRGALDKPTPWQVANIPGILEYYRDLPGRIVGLLRQCKDYAADITVLASHYGVSYSNLKGEKPSIHPFLASQRMSEAVRPELVDLVIHAHAHNAVVEYTLVNNVPVYNASLPGRGRVVIIEVKPRRSVLNWLVKPR
uniref:Metallophosphoesterase n=1 Tax=Thermosphaera aggregans TaxID=54254 RepID=A0A7C2BK50_9CREN